MATYEFDAVENTTIAFDPPNDTLNFALGTGSAAQLRFVAVGTDLQVFLGDRWVMLGATSYAALGSDDFTFADGSQMLLGTAASEALAGGAGNDYLDGRAGNDTLAGGAGDDTYLVDSGGDTLVEAAGEGTDTVRSTVSTTLGANLENLWLTGTGAINGFGNTLDNTIFAGDGNNLLAGGTGNDTLSYLYASGGVTVSLNLLGAQATGSSGTDTIGGFETLVGSLHDDSLQGSGGANLVSGLDGNDTLAGGAGYDTLLGGAGDDTYLVDDPFKTIVESDADPLTGGIDLVVSSLGSTVLAANVENLRFTATGTANGYGNAGANTFFAGAGNNLMNGGAGIDTVSYADATGGVTLSLALSFAQATGSSGIDTVLNVENLIGSAFADNLTGSGAANLIAGGAGNDFLRGNGGDDTLVGGAGDDTYHIDSLLDVLVENAGEGIDTVQTLVDLTLADNFENARALGANAVTITGNALDNVIWAGLGSATLDGGAGRDTISYEFATQGVQATVNGIVYKYVYSSSYHDQLAGFENLTGSAFQDSLSGDAADNRLEGLAGNDYLDGLGGADTLVGGSGNDRYVIRTGTVAIETDANPLSGGIDDVTVAAGVVYTLGDYIENAFVGDATNVTGNALDNLFELTYAAHTTLDGGAGVDTLRFGSAYYSGGTANLQTGLVTYGGATSHVSGFENLVGSSEDDNLTGDDGANRIDGGSDGRDILYGGGGNDTLAGSTHYDETDLYYGGTGDDTYYVALGTGTYVGENAGEGTDLIMLTYGSGTYGASVLPDNVENLRFTNYNSGATGNGMDNTFFAFDGRNTVHGAGGNDTLSFQYAPSAVVANLQNGVTSRVGSAGSGYVTGIENLVGSLYDDTLTGDSNANRINGSIGNDRITGGQGGDTLTGGSGADTFVYTSYTESSPAFDAITDFSGAAGDRIDLSAIDADTLTAGNQAFTFIGSAAFGADATGQLRYANGVLYGSNDADATAEFAIVLSGSPAVSAGDFIL